MNNPDSMDIHRLAREIAGAEGLYEDDKVMVRSQDGGAITQVLVKLEDGLRPVFHMQAGTPDPLIRYNPGRWTNHLSKLRQTEGEDQDETRTPAGDRDVFPKEDQGERTFTVNLLSPDMEFNEMLELAKGVAERTGAKVAATPDCTHGRPFWNHNWLECKMGSERPHLMAKKGAKSIAVNVVTHHPMLGNIKCAKEAGDYARSGQVLCMPDVTKRETPKSCLEYADSVQVRIAKLSELQQTLQELLD